MDLLPEVGDLIAEAVVAVAPIEADPRSTLGKGLASCEGNGFIMAAVGDVGRDGPIEAGEGRWGAIVPTVYPKIIVQWQFLLFAVVEDAAPARLLPMLQGCWSQLLLPVAEEIKGRSQENKLGHLGLCLGDPGGGETP